MTNLFLTITLATNIGITRIDVNGMESDHLYAMQTACVIVPVAPTTNWQTTYIFTSSSITWYDTTESNKFYRVQDLGLKF